VGYGSNDHRTADSDCDSTADRDSDNTADRDCDSTATRSETTGIFDRTRHRTAPPPHRDRSATAQHRDRSATAPQSREPRTSPTDLSAHERADRSLACASSRARAVRTGTARGRVSHRVQNVRTEYLVFTYSRHRNQSSGLARVYLAHFAGMHPAQARRRSQGGALAESDWSPTPVAERDRRSRQQSGDSRVARRHGTEGEPACRLSGRKRVVRETPWRLSSSRESFALSNDTKSRTIERPGAFTPRCPRLISQKLPRPGAFTSRRLQLTRQKPCLRFHTL
jgi:hypothetical protein